MNDPRSESELDALFASARERRPDTSAVEFAFETRLMARLRSARSVESIWAKVSWRMIPVFAACVMALAIWHARVIADTDEAEQVAYMENPQALDSLTYLN